MIFRKTTGADIAAVLSIYEDARETMAAKGIDQWTDGYPSEATLRADIAAGESYVLAADDGSIMATSAVMHHGEPCYTTIDGVWLTENSDPAEGDRIYTTIHRIATAKDFRGRGLASRMIAEAMLLAQKEHKKSLRIDTHEDNRPMQGMLARSGFTYCGIIRLADGSPRCAYEKLL